MSSPVASLDIERMVRIDQQIDASESTALRARWEFGHQMLAARDGAGRLPNGYLAALVGRTGKSRSELSYREFTNSWVDLASLHASPSLSAHSGVVAASSVGDGSASGDELRAHTPDADHPDGGGA